jgi:hypothetical protein
MKYTRLKVAGHDVCKVAFLDDQETLKHVTFQAEAKAPYTHINDPSARERSEREILNAQLLGTLADKACTDLLQSYLKRHAPGRLIAERYDDVRTDEYKKRDSFDTRVVKPGENRVLAEIEIRSSVCNKIPLEPMIRTWHVLGWYVTQNKPVEKIRDFYMRPIYHYNLFNAGKAYQLKDAESHLMKGALDLYIVGGATPYILETRGEVQRGFGLLQKGATYQVVHIKNSPGVGDLLKAVMELCVSKADS